VSTGPWGETLPGDVPYTPQEWVAPGGPAADGGRVTATFNALTAALLALRDTDRTDGDDFRLPGPCWCAGWWGTVEHGHCEECMQARRAMGLEP
jgi:hypothetical protein